MLLTIIKMLWIVRELKLSLLAKCFLFGTNWVDGLFVFADLGNQFDSNLNATKFDAIKWKSSLQMYELDIIYMYNVQYLHNKIKTVCCLGRGIINRSKI